MEFRCQVIDREGKNIVIMRDAMSEQQCVIELVSQGFTPLKLRTGKANWIELLNSPIRLSGNSGTSAQAVFLRQLSILVAADLPVDRSLDMLRDQAVSAKQRQAIARMLSDVRAGQSLAKAMESEGNFPAWVIGIVRASETGGNLGAALTQAADRMSTLASTRRALVSALTYPFAVLIATLIALMLILTLVVPQFKPLFVGSEDKLPKLTLAVIWLSDNASEFGVTALLSLVITIIAGWVFLKSEAGCELRQNRPTFFPGQRLRDQYLAAQFSGLFSTLLLNGVHVVKAFSLASDAISSLRWRKQLQSALERVREGERLSRAIGKAKAYPDTARRLVEVGERSGRLGETCREASKIMNDIASQRIEAIVSLVNPIAIILLGGVVAMLVAGVMLGIFALGDFAG